MKNQSLRGKLEVSMVCVGAIEWARSCQGVKSVGGGKCKVGEAFRQGLMS